MNENNDLTEINDVAPTSLNHLIGQRGVIDQVKVALDAAQMDNKKFDHALLVGPPGMGKSALAAVIAQEMAGGFHEILRTKHQELCGPQRPPVGGTGQRCRSHRRVPRTRQGTSNGVVSRRR